MNPTKVALMYPLEPKSKLDRPLSVHMKERERKKEKSPTKLNKSLEQGLNLSGS
jgi:hypothetical protein